MRASLKAWLPFAVALTVVAGLAYAVVQYVVRESANDPQIQMAEDWADQVRSGIGAIGLQTNAFIDPNLSLSAFGIIYDASGNIMNSSITAPTTMLLPDGVMAAVDRAPKGQSRFTWAPASGERFAAVVQRTQSENKVYYVLAARNLREVDRRISLAKLIICTFWVVGLVAVFASLHTHVAVHAVRRLRKKKS
ncbi:MAG TPA: hypothetical protein VJM32_00340 [Candidatus Saccharimonadales bacterium]|nr:hypothetical protein [Candidatus Saccharimonadales bacterium]